MPSGTLLLSALVNLAAAAAFACAGARFLRPAPTEVNRLAQRGFALYWLGTAAYTAQSGVMDALAYAGVTSFPLFLAVRYLSIPVLCAALAGGSYYLLYLYTGRKAWVWLASGLYAVVGLAMTFYVASRRPYGVVVTDWRTDLAYAAPYEATPVFSLLLLLLVLPPIAGGVAYALLARRVQDRAARRRVLLVGLGIAAWSLAALAARLSESSGLVQLLSRPVAGALVATLVLLAYARPRTVDA
ncbi:MAG TPA: hypothetical protein VNX21_09500 [Candidatus Thermoplasmatota archaeon]|nr:hypothetical protein [Candidatus Thermoplasmatota archaeon]